VRRIRHVIGPLAMQQFARARNELALPVPHDELADDACVRDVALETFPALADQAREILGQRHRNTDRSEDEKFERPLERGRLLSYGFTVVVVRHSPGRASSSRRPAGSGA